MKQPTVTSFFLGANSESGFYSIYDQFCTAPSDMLHIIKSGPGTGKSTFMRQIGHAAEMHGLDVEYILCSGDPDSLDGVYIPALHTGWVDGTAPHVIEPSLFGAAADYVNLGQFCSTSLLGECRALIRSLNIRYKKHYANAYTYLHAAGELYRQQTHLLPYDAEQKLCNRARSKIRRELDKQNTGRTVTKRFVRAISCSGDTVLTKTVNTLCQRLCIVESHFGLEEIFFREMLAEIQAQGASCILCPSPLCPERIEAIILPIEGMCFVSIHSVLPFSGSIRTIHLDSYLSEVHQKEYKTREQLCNGLMDAALAELKEAKLLHDELEACYRPALNTDALNAYTDSTITAFFS